LKGLFRFLFILKNSQKESLKKS